MNSIRLLLTALAGTALMATVAFANPATLVPHPGYPMGDTKSPVDGVRTSHDAGQPSAGGASASILAASTADGAAMVQTLDPNNMRKMKSKGAGQLPDVEGALNRVNINPAGATSTVIN
jgi:hypothetical protein